MGESNPIDLMQGELEQLQNEYLDEAIDGLAREIEKSMQRKRNAFYMPSTWRYESERLARISQYLNANLDAERENARFVKRHLADEDNLSSYLSQRRVGTAKKNSSSPYFARVDYAENGGKIGKTIYIGSTHLSADILSWKEPLAALYYKKAFGEKLHIERNEVELDMLREITIDQGELVTLHPEQRRKEEIDPRLVEKLALKKGDEMRALVDSLQAEQYELVRLPIEEPIVVQGSAGSGKSVIALHRLSYILYNFKQLKAKQIAIVGPNKLFLKHIENVLPELGEQEIVQMTLKSYLEEMLPNQIEIEEVDRMILSEVLDLSVAEGREQAIKTFNSYTTMSGIKGTLKYKEYIEQYMDYIIKDLSPFMKNITMDHLAISGIEMSQFIYNETHYGDSKANLKKFVEQQLREKASKISTIYAHLIQCIEAAVQANISDLLQNNIVELTSTEIEAQIAVVQQLFEKHRRMDRLLKERYYNQLLDEETLLELQQIEYLEEKDLLTKEQAAKKVTHALNELHEQQNALKNLIESYNKELVENVLVNFEEQIIVHLDLKQQMLEHVNAYCELFYQQFLYTTATDLFATKEYANVEKINDFVQELNTELMPQILKEWQTEEKKLRQVIQSKILLELKERFAYQLEQKLIRNSAELKKLQVFIQSCYMLPTYLSDKQIIDVEAVSAEIDKLYLTEADKVYQAILEDRYNYAQRIPIKIDHAFLKQYTTIEKQDLPALYIIHKYISPTFEKPFQYLVVDEAQDYSLFEMYVLNDLTNQIMLMGDLGQNLSVSNRITQWQKFSEVIGKFRYYELNATYRSTKQIVDFSNDIIREFSNGKYKLPQVTFRNGKPVERIVRSGQAIYQGIRDLINRLLNEQSEYTKIAIIAKTLREAKQLHEALNIPEIGLQVDSAYRNERVIITTPLLAKGLEYDVVIIYRFGRFAKTDLYDTKLAYVAASRALHELYVYI